jgi:hypothetical protein
MWTRDNYLGEKIYLLEIFEVTMHHWSYSVQQWMWTWDYMVFMRTSIYEILEVMYTIWSYSFKISTFSKDLIILSFVHSNGFDKLGVGTPV